MYKLTQLTLLMGILYTVTINQTSTIEISSQTSYTPQYEAVRRLHPKLSPKTTKQVALALAYLKADPSCTIPWQLLLSIAFHESSLRLDVVGVKNPLTKDYGLMQINERNVRALNLNRYRLLSDPVYSMQAACSILMAAKKAHSKEYIFWLGAYRAGYGLSKEKTRQSAEKYDRIIRVTAKKIGYYERNKKHGAAKIYRSEDNEENLQASGSCHRASSPQDDQRIK